MTAPAKPAIQQKINFTSTNKTQSTHASSSLHGSQPSSRHSSVEIQEVPDAETYTRRNAGPPKNPESIIEAADGSDDSDVPARVMKKRKNRMAEREVEEVEVEVAEGPAAKKTKGEETAEEELGQ